MLRSGEYSHSHRARHNVMIFVGRDVGPSVLRDSVACLYSKALLHVCTWLSSSTTATTALTAHLLLLAITTTTILLSTMISTFNRRSLSQTPVRPWSPLRATTPPPLRRRNAASVLVPDTPPPALTAFPSFNEEDEDKLEWDHLTSESDKENCSPPSTQTEFRCQSKSMTTNAQDDRGRHPLEAMETRCSCDKCEIFQTCEACKMFLTRESLGLQPPTLSKSPTTSALESSPVQESQASGWEQAVLDSLPVISCSRSLNLDMIGRTNALLNLSRTLAASTTFHESAMKMADIIFIVSSTSNENSTSRTSTVSASDHLKMTRAESALSKLIATYFQLRSHPTTLGTIRASTVMSCPQTASDLVLEDLTSLATTCGQEAWLKQTKRSFLKTLAAILREISSCSTTRFSLLQTQNGTQSQQNYLAWKRMASSSTGNVTRKHDAGSSKPSATRFRVSKPRRGDSPTPQRPRQKIDGSLIIDLTSDSDDQSL